MRKQTRVAALALLCAGTTLTAACGSDDPAGGGDDGTITWWHNSNNEPGKGYYEQVAADFEEDNPGVTVEVTAMAHEDMVDKLAAAFQSGDLPDVYMERGGGELAAHVDAGLTRDLTEDAAEEIEAIGGSVAGWQVDDRTYALPFSLGVVGVWYNTEEFEKAGVQPPTTMTEWTQVNDELKAAGITPISLGAGDRWPAAHYWYYAAVRTCSQDVLTQAVADLDFSDPCFVEAGEVVQDFVETEPFNKGFLATPAQEGANSASGLLATGKVASEMQGHWEPGVMQAPHLLPTVTSVRDVAAPALLVHEIRSIARDDLWLSPFRGRDTVAAHFTWRPDLDLVRPALRAVEDAFAPWDPRTHWGKITTTPALRDPAGAYDRAAFEALRTRLDPAGVFRNELLGPATR